MYQLEYLDLEENSEYEKTIKKVIEACFKEEKLENSKLYISITLTTPSNIRKINNEYRNVDKETDVLSFPMFEKNELEEMIKNNHFEHEDVLGDIVICEDVARENAVKYEHSYEREIFYLIVHGIFHLLGFDHENEDEKHLMRAAEEAVLNKFKIRN